MSKAFKVGLYVGRFQPMHRGHESIIRKALKICDIVIVAIGSSQEEHTERNPFSVSLRAEMIKKIFKREYECQCLYVMGVRDREDPADNSEWGEYLLDSVKIATGGLEPDVIIEGFETTRRSWFSENLLSHVVINRTNLPISGTQVRKYLEDDNRTEWRHTVNKVIWPYYDKLRKELKLCEKKE